MAAAVTTAPTTVGPATVDMVERRTIPVVTTMVPIITPRTTLTTATCTTIGKFTMPST